MRIKAIAALALVAAIGLTAGDIAWGQGAGRVGRPAQGGNVPADFDTITTGIVAHAGGGQTNATLCATTICQVDTVATAADSVALLQCTIAPQRQMIINTTANAVQVFGSGTDTINGVATGTGVSLAATSKSEFVCTKGGAAATWWH